MKRLLVVTSTLPRWNGDHTPPFVLELSRQLSKKYEVHILAPYSKGAKSFEHLDRVFIHRFKYWYDRENNLADGAILPNLRKKPFLWLQVPFYIIFEFLSVRKMLLTHKFDAVHAHWILTPGLSCSLNRGLMKNANFIITTHGADVFSLKYLNFLKKWTIKRCNTLTVVSNQIRKEIIKLATTTEVKVLPMGIDTSKFTPSNFSQAIKDRLKIYGPFLLFVGRIAEKKGLQYLLEAMPDIIKFNQDTKLIIIGTGPLEEHLRRLCLKLKISDNVIFLGGLSNSELPAYYASADIFIGPSITANDGDTEGLGLVFVEAIASGCTTIASDLPAISDVITDNVNGYIVSQKSSSEISKCVIRLLTLDTNSSLSKTRRESIVNKFDWELVGKHYAAILSEPQNQATHHEI